MKGSLSRPEYGELRGAKLAMRGKWLIRRGRKMRIFVIGENAGNQRLTSVSKNGRFSE